MIISLVNQKGGVGKTTIAVHLAYWFSQKGSVVLIDADAQQSSSIWLKDLNLPCKVCNDPDDLFDLLGDLVDKYDVVVVDGPASLSEVTKTILGRADFALIPCKPTGLDLNSSNQILRMARQTRQMRGGSPQCALLLNQVRGAVLLRDAQEVLGKLEFPLMKSLITSREIIADAPGQGMTVWQMSGSAARSAEVEFEALFKEALEVFNG